MYTFSVFIDSTRKTQKLEDTSTYFYYVKHVRNEIINSN